jgi:hypothetical protein
MQTNDRVEPPAAVSVSDKRLANFGGIVYLYHAIYYLYRIDKVEVVKQTPYFVVLKRTYGEIKGKKNSTDSSFHETFDEVKNALTAAQKSKILKMRSQLDYAQKELEKIEALSEGL